MSWLWATNHKSLQCENCGKLHDKESTKWLHFVGTVNVDIGGKRYNLSGLYVCSSKCFEEYIEKMKLEAGNS